MRRSGRPGLLAVFRRTARSTPARQEESLTGPQESPGPQPDDATPDVGSTIPARTRIDVEGQEDRHG